MDDHGGSDPLPVKLLCEEGILRMYVQCNACRSEESASMPCKRNAPSHNEKITFMFIITLPAKVS